MNSGLQSEEDKRLIRYLLGDLPQFDAEQLEERYFCESPFFDRVADLEGQLIRQYLRRELSPGDTSLFERKYFGTPELHVKVEFLRQLGEQARVSIPNEQRLMPNNDSRWHRLFQPVLVAPAFAALSIILGIGFWSATQNARLRTEISRVPSTSAAAKANPERETLSSSPDEVVALTLLPGLTKSLSGDQGRRVAWSPALREIRIHFELPGFTEDVSLGLELMLVEARGRRSILSRNGLHSIVTTSGRKLVFGARPEELLPGDYIALVKRDDGTTVGEVVEAYSFAVLRQ